MTSSHNTFLSSARRRVRPLPLALTAILSASFLAAPVVSLPAGGPVTPNAWTLPLTPAAASVHTATLFGNQSVPSDTETFSVEPQDTEPFDLVAVTWDQSQGETAPEVQVRVLENDTWSDWETLPALDEGPDAGTDEYERARGGTSPLLTSQASGIEVQLVAAPDSLVDPQVELVDAESGSSDTTSVPLATASAAASAPSIITRAVWGADESLKNGTSSYSSTLKAGIVHHTASTNSYSASDSAAQVRAIYAYHTNSLGWNDIGYNFLVDRFGKIYEGRSGGLDRAVVGAHAGGFNAETVGVSALGNYEEATAPAAMVDSIASVMAWKLDAYGRDPQGSTTLTSAGGGTSRYPAGQSVSVRTISGHRDVGLTACPGQNLYPALGSIRTKAAGIVQAAAAAHNPNGTLDRAAGVPGGVQLAGHVKDPDTNVPVELHVYIDGAWGGAHTATQQRSDGRFGFTLTLPTSPGTHQVCVYAINQGTGSANPSLGCNALTRTTGNPIGNLEAISAGAGGARLVGWVLDPDTTAAADLHVYVNGGWGGVVKADTLRNDVGNAYPLMGNNHGFDKVLPLPGGTHSVCVYAINQGIGNTNPSLGCKSVTVKSSDPLGNLDGLSSAPGTLTVNGWALDPDVNGAIPVHVYVDGRYAGEQLADKTRNDVVFHHPGYNNQKGYSLTLPATAGSHQVCAYAINQGVGTTNTSLGCKNVTVPGGDPLGNFETVTGGTSTLNIIGWALDPDVAGAIPVHVYVDGRYAGAHLADKVRNDVASHYPGYTNQKGINLTLSAFAGSRQVCVYAINQQTGVQNTSLGCKNVTVR